jgi:hypothetical protein
MTAFLLFLQLVKAVGFEVVAGDCGGLRAGVRADLDTIIFVRAGSDDVGGCLDSARPGTKGRSPKIPTLAKTCKDGAPALGVIIALDPSRLLVLRDTLTITPEF